MINEQLNNITKKLFNVFPFDWIDVDQTCWGYDGELKHALHILVHHEDNNKQVIFKFDGTYEEFDVAIEAAREGMELKE